MIVMLHLEGKSIKKCLKDRIVFSLNPARTEYVSFYACILEAVVEEFMRFTKGKHIAVKKK